MPTAPKLEAPQGLPLFEVQFRAISESLTGNGLLSSSALEVTEGSSALEIDVASGDALYNGSQYSFGGSSPAATISSGDGTYRRWDTVAFDTATTSVVVREGTPEEYPSPPDIQGDEILLAVIHVPAGATDIGPNDILNWRGTASTPAADDVPYDDSTGQYGVDSVDAALDMLQYAAQADSHPFDAGDIANSITPTWTGKHRYESAQEWQEMATPANPATGYYRFYVKSDGNLYKLAPDGTESQVGGSSSGPTKAEMVVDSPNGHIPVAYLEDGDTAEISVPVPDGETLTVYRWGGYSIADGTVPQYLYVRALDGSDSEFGSQSTANNENTSGIVSQTNSTGSLSIYKLRLDNQTGNDYLTDGLGAFFSYVVE